MRAWILIVWLTGCCADTYEIAADRADQPVAQIVFRLPGTPDATESGILAMYEDAGPFHAILSTPGPSSYRLHVPETTGTFSGQLEIRRPMQATETIPVIVTATGVQQIKVCMSPDQNDYGTGRCGFSFLGTLEFTGVTGSLGDVSATWVMRQIATVEMGTPDC